MSNKTKIFFLGVNTSSYNLFLLCLLFLVCQCTPTQKITQEITEQAPPNILLIIVDDLGYSDLGCYGSEINTENMDALAKEGLRFTNFYASPNCSPTRAMLMTGMDNHLAGIGAMAVGPNQKGKPGYENFLNNRTVAFSELVKDKGYRTYYTGKWHLGTNEISNPNARGFDKAWWQVGGAPGSHFDLSAPNPRFKQYYFENKIPQREAPADFFSTNFFTDQLIAYLEEDTDKAQPFLGVLSFSAVHIPVHCPESHIDLYKGKYKEGYEALRLARLQKQKELGITAQNVNLPNLLPNASPWEELTKAEKLVHARRMEVYAGMVDNMDDNVGKLVAYLKKTQQYDNTLIFLMSDNGGAGFNGYQSKGGKKGYELADNSIGNLGRKGSKYFIGAGWGSAISTPFRLFKRHISEGGLRIPMIISGGYLNSIPSSKSKYRTINPHVFTVRDIAPTIQEIVGVEYPTKTYKDRELLPQTGKSFAKVIRETPTFSIHPKEEIFGWELFKRKAVQKNDWKILWIEPDFGKGNWELFNLKEDPSELNDLAEKYPDKLKEMINAWEQYQQDNNVIISNGELFFP